MTQDDVLLHLRAAQVEITVLEADHLVHINAVLDVERRRLRRIEDAQLGADDLDLARLDVRVDRLFAARADLAADGDAELVAQGLCLVERSFVHGSLVEYDLDEARAVAHVDEDQSAVVTTAGDPAAEHDFLADVRLAKGTAMMGALHTL